MSSWPLFDDLSFLLVPLEQQFQKQHVLILNTLGPLQPNLLKKLNIDLVSHVINQSDFSPGTKPLLLLSLDLVSKIFMMGEIATFELNSIKLETIELLLVNVYELYNEEETVGVIVTFLASLHGQFCKKHDTSTQSTIPEIMQKDSLLGMRKEISMAICLLYNRADSPYLQEAIVNLLHQLFTQNPDFFYTNDCSVLFDVTMRNILQVSDETLRHSMIQLLPRILDSVPVSSPGSAFTAMKQQMERNLGDIISSPTSTPSTQIIAQKTLSGMK